jgi:hypothetical protein
MSQVVRSDLELLRANLFEMGLALARVLLKGSLGEVNARRWRVPDWPAK